MTYRELLKKLTMLSVTEPERLDVEIKVQHGKDWEKIISVGEISGTGDRGELVLVDNEGLWPGAA